MKKKHKQRKIKKVKTTKGVKKMVKRGKGGVSFVSIVKDALNKGITDSEEIVKLAKNELPGLDEKKLKARVNATIKYLGEKPVKKEKQVKVTTEKPKKEDKKETPVTVTPVKEEKKIETPKVETPTTESVKGPDAAQAKLGDALTEKKDDGLGDIEIQ